MLSRWIVKCILLVKVIILIKLFSSQKPVLKFRLNYLPKAIVLLNIF